MAVVISGGVLLAPLASDEELTEHRRLIVADTGDCPAPTDGDDGGAEHDDDAAPVIPSPFDCASPAGLCTYFYPATFFRPCGPGSDHAGLINETARRMATGELWKNMPLIGFPTVSLGPNATSSPFSRGPSPARNLTSIHVHKAGGTSVRKAVMNLGRTGQGKVTRRPFFRPPRAGPGALVDPRRRGRGVVGGGNNATGTIDPGNGGAAAAGARSAIGGPNGRPPRPDNFPDDGRAWKAAQHALDHAVRYRRSAKAWGAEGHLFFTVVRDPLERFISSIGQAMGARGSSNNGVAQHFQQTCIAEGRSVRDTLRCCVDYVRERTTFVEVHFTPQALELSFATMGRDVPVAVFQIGSLPDVLADLGQEPDLKERAGAGSAYRPHPVLSNMTVAHYDTDMKRELCNMYAVDVFMQRSLGVEVPLCDQFIPTAHASKQ